ncbi:hypothetical protein TNIN_151951 [Trichonephila inaurata madagascariensis]|uniref:Uncharacterized protein n=1 Tax=Trichonephila inaurata madagascariensis TaxID=2747483 RepID=A0A8X6MDY7_9ARAC|nr:hypothetical protein TNIN_151951 [Trichonephila inaurata madagascariensis]
MERSLSSVIPLILREFIVALRCSVMRTNFLMSVVISWSRWQLGSRGVPGRVELLDEGNAINPFIVVLSSSSKPCCKIGIKIDEGVRSKRLSPYSFCSEKSYRYDGNLYYLGLLLKQFAFQVLKQQVVFAPVRVLYENRSQVHAGGVIHQQDETILDPSPSITPNDPRPASPLTLSDDQVPAFPLTIPDDPNPEMKNPH